MNETFQANGNKSQVPDNSSATDLESNQCRILQEKGGPPRIKCVNNRSTIGFSLWEVLYSSAESLRKSRHEKKNKSKDNFTQWKSKNYARK